MLGLFTFLFYLAMTVLGFGVAALLLKLGRKVTQLVGTRRGSWEAYTETRRGRIDVGIQRKTGVLSPTPERQVLHQLPLSSVSTDPDLLYLKKAEASETAATLNRRTH